MCARGVGEGEETARSDVRFSCGGQFTARVPCLVKKSNQDGSWHAKVLCDTHGQLLDAFSLCPGRRAGTCTCPAGIEDRPDGYVDAVPEDCTPFLSAIEPCAASGANSLISEWKLSAQKQPCPFPTLGS